MQWVCRESNYRKDSIRIDDRIGSLIDELIDVRREALRGGNCPYCGKNCPCEENSYNCDECKDSYFEKMRAELIEEYKVVWNLSLIGIMEMKLKCVRMPYWTQ